MTPTERRNLAESLLANPLFDDIMSGLERAAIEQCIYATDDDTRRFCAQKVQAVRSFRQDCVAALRNTPSLKGAPA